MVDPKVLRSTGRRFERVGEELADLRPDAPLSAASPGVYQLATGPACTQAQENIATQMKSLAEVRVLTARIWKTLRSSMSRPISRRPVPLARSGFRNILSHSATRRMRRR
jgi:hypothetical protein